MKRSRYCCSCNLVIAPADPSRIVRKGRAAHDHCIVSRELMKIRTEAADFFRTNGTETVAADFAERALKVRSRKSMAYLIAECAKATIAPAGAKPRSGVKREVGKFLTLMSDKLFMDIPR